MEDQGIPIRATGDEESLGDELVDGQELEDELIEYFSSYTIPKGAVTIAQLIELTGKTDDVIRHELESRVKVGKLEKKKIGPVNYYYKSESHNK